MGTELTYDIASFCCCFIVVTNFVAQCAYRTYIRKAGGVQSRVYLYMVAKKIDSFSISVIFMYIVILAWTLAFYKLTEEPIVLLIGVLGPVLAILYLAGFLYYSKNDYHFLQNMDRENKKITSYNSRLAKTKAAAKKLKKLTLEEGPSAVFGEENAALVVKVMDAQI